MTTYTNLLTCDACEESFDYDFLHYCSCGARLCQDCYTEDQHIDHDAEPPHLAAIPPTSDAYRATTHAHANPRRHA
jgi:hypothetical protein